MRNYLLRRNKAILKELNKNNLALWALHSNDANFMRYNGKPYIKLNGKWHVAGGGIAMNTKNKLMNNIRRSYNASKI